ncbi:MAG TPA: hypothetical protein ENJ82_10745, partial [Bacteroidetes bacterium]|nr:hypothetical protein [Bacteroidota bacterium]
MTFTPRKYKDIFDEMRAMSQVVTDFEVGSVARTMYESFSYEMALLYEKMNMVYLSAYVDTAKGNQLDQVVAVLGIVRSQPDFAEGTVSFRREGGGQEIVIPIGTLVATEESSTGEKTVYETVKAASLGASRTNVDVAVRAVSRGEAQEAAADEVVVMPRPVPGIKFVNNDAPIRLVGKRRETDEQLRERAKNTLISSGKATILSIENALLSLSGVRDARVRENFYAPRALVKITNKVTLKATIPRGAILSVLFGGKDHYFKTLDPISFKPSDIIGTGKEVKVEALVEGQAGEINLSPPLPMQWQDGAMVSKFDASILTPAKLEDFGLIEVYVDAPRLEEGTPTEIAIERQRIEAEIEKVRAAGIFSILKPAGKVVTNGIFRIDLSASLTLSPEERREFEERVEDEIEDFLIALRMGKPLLYGKLVKAILSLENIENLNDFRGSASRKVLQEELLFPFTFSDPEKFIEVEAFERIQARHIGVASEDKELKVHIAYQSLNLSSVEIAAVADQLNNLFGGKDLGETIKQSEIETAILAGLGGPSIEANSLVLRPESWFPGPAEDPRALIQDLTGPVDKEVVVTYVEQLVPGTVFGYADRIQITGAIKLILPLNILADEKVEVRDAVATAVAAYLDQLGPEADIVFADLVEAAQTVSLVLAAEVDSDDFRAILNGNVQPNVIDNE